MSKATSLDFAALYTSFEAPISIFDCGNKCAPYNEYGVPFCCDTAHAIPTAFTTEWAYLAESTDLWHLWEDIDPEETERLLADTPDGQVLIECLGHKYCQRKFRSITCRAFPFFPYVSKVGEFLGLSYYWEYEDRCWIINHLQVITLEYVREFVMTYARIFDKWPHELENFQYHAMVMRRVFGRQHRKIPLVHRDGSFYEVTTKDGTLNSIDPASLPKFGDYAIAAEMPFPDEDLILP
jgi:hypothetical protein